ncbi:MAG: bifunctional enoyl-CoA hydratase/phosphate acetyltransferase [Planctomycetota bacterium]|nr:bifunctional enoyl-CoA hydratase/phosphate acetyltransferase [Planctomycetota bacterium]
MEAIRSTIELVDRAKRCGIANIAVVAAHEPSVLEGVDLAWREGLCRGILIGDGARIEAIAREIGMDLSPHRVIHQTNDAVAMGLAIDLVKSGEARALNKGIISTGKFMHALLVERRALGASGRLSHVAVFGISGFDRLMILTDPAVNISPDLPTKVEIVRNAVWVAHRLGVSVPNVAMLAATEKILYPDMPSTVDAALLAKMSECGQIPGCVVDGPLALDNAVSAEAARIKGVRSPVAGKADILVAHNIEAANICYKALVHLTDADVCGMVVGLSFPVLVNSRADPPRFRLLSAALAIATSANARPEGDAGEGRAPAR